MENVFKLNVLNNIFSKKVFSILGTMALRRNKFSHCQVTYIAIESDKLIVDLC